MQKKLISIREIVKKFSIPSSTVNHYTIMGLLPVADRRKNVRLYEEEEVKERLARIAELKSNGYPLQLIHKELYKSQ